MGLTLKLNKRASMASRQELERALKDLRLHAEPLLPGPGFEDFANVLSVDVPERRAKAVMTRLAELKAVQSVEPEPKRRLF